MFQVPVQITQHPWDEMHVVEGETVSLTVKAKGFPPPKFMWCKDQAIIEGAVYGTYQFEAQRSVENILIRLEFTLFPLVK